MLGRISCAPVPLAEMKSLSACPATPRGRVLTVDEERPAGPIAMTACRTLNNSRDNGSLDTLEVESLVAKPRLTN